MAEPGHAERVLSVLRDGAATPLAASWRRSLTLHQLDPENRKPPETLSGAELRAAQEQMGPLLAAAQDNLDALFQAVGDGGCCVLLTNADGVPVDRRGGEVVGEATGPIFWPAAGPCIESRSVVIGADPAKGVSGRNVDARVDEGDVPPLEVEVDGVDVLSTAGDARGNIPNEEGAIRAQLSRELFEFRDGVAEVKQAVEQGQGEGAICTASAETGAGGEGLDEVEVDRREGVSLGEQGVGTADEVVLGGASDRPSVQMEGASVSRSGGGDLQRVAPRNGEEEAVEGMEPILTAVSNLEPKVDLGVGEGDPSGRAGINHRSSRIA